MKPVDHILRALGLNESEIKTYLAALEHGAGTVIELSKLTRLSRQATYLAIEDLTSRGLMTSVIHGKKKLYSAERPARLLDYARRRQVDFSEQTKWLERLVPELELQVGGERPVVKVYEGKEGIRAIIEEMKKSGHSVNREITDLQAMYKVLTPEDLLPLRLTVKKLRSKVRGLYAGTPIKKIADVDRRMLPKEYSGFQSNITIYADKIMMVTFTGKMTSVTVESEALAKTLSILFDLAFKTAKELPEGSPKDK